MSRWSPTVQPTTQFASNEGLLQGITGASATLLRALEQRQGRKIDAQRYADQQGRLDRGEARQTERDAVEDKARTVAMQNSQLGALSTARDLGYVEGPTAGDRLAPVRGVGNAGLPGMAGVGASAASQLASALDAAPSSSMEVAGPMGSKSLRYDPTQTKDARDETRSLAMLGRTQGFAADQQRTGQQFQEKMQGNSQTFAERMQNNSQAFQGSQNAASRAQQATLANLARGGTKATLPTEGERKAAALYSVAEQGYQTLEGLLTKKDNTGNAVMGPDGTPVQRGAPGLLERNLQRVGMGAGNLLTNDQQRQMTQAALQLSDMWLRYTSGAAVPEQEVERFAQTFTPLPGDDAKTLTQKQNARAKILGALKGAAGRALSVPPHAGTAPDLNDPGFLQFLRQQGGQP